jgi:hypothetical protein
VVERSAMDGFRTVSMVNSWKVKGRVILYDY